MWASSWESTVLRRSGDHSRAPAGSNIRGRRDPQVRGIDAGSADRRIRTGRAIRSRWHWLETICAQLSSTIGTTDAVRADTHASRAKPASSFTTMKRAPSAHQSSVNPSKRPESGEADTASITVDGNFGTGTLPPAALAALQNLAALPSVAECHDGRRRVNIGSANAQAIPRTQAWWRMAAELRRMARATTAVNVSTNVALTVQLIRNDNASSELPGQCIISSPSGFW